MHPHLMLSWVGLYILSGMSIGSSALRGIAYRLVQQTDRHADHGTCDDCSNRPRNAIDPRLIDVPKIIINDPITFFLRLQSALW